MGNKPIVHAPIATGSTEPRDIRDRFADFVNLKDFGAAGDGVTDDSAAWSAWETALQSGGIGFAPAGEYVVDNNTISLDRGRLLVETPGISDNSNKTANTKWVRDYIYSLLPQSTVYVDSNNGDDSNNGLTSLTPKKTISAAVSAGIGQTGCIPGYIKVMVNPGQYNESLIGYHGVVVEYVGVFVDNTMPTVNSIGADTSAVVYLSGRFTIDSGRIEVLRNSVLHFVGNSYVYFKNLGNVGSAIYVAVNSTISIPYSVSVNFYFTGTAGTVTVGTLQAINNGVFSVYGTAAWAGDVAGPRYSATRCSVIMGIGSPSYIPGTSNGNVDSTSFFI